MQSTFTPLNETLAERIYGIGLVKTSAGWQVTVLLGKRTWTLWL